MGRRVLVFIAALFAVGFATAQPGVSAASTVDQVESTATAAPAVGGRLISSPDCAVRSGSVIGICPMPLLAVPKATHPRLQFCASAAYMPFVILHRHMNPSLCGTGFHARANVFILIKGLYGSTFWRVVADKDGSFYSGLPWPMCGLTPGKVGAFDEGDARSNSLPLLDAGCR